MDRRLKTLSVCSVLVITGTLSAYITFGTDAHAFFHTDEDTEENNVSSECVICQTIPDIRTSMNFSMPSSTTIKIDDLWYRIAFVKNVAAENSLVGSNNAHWILNRDRYDAVEDCLHANDEINYVVSESLRRDEHNYSLVLVFCGNENLAGLILDTPSYVEANCEHELMAPSLAKIWTPCGR